MAIKSLTGEDRLSCSRTKFSATTSRATCSTEGHSVSDLTEVSRLSPDVDFNRGSNSLWQLSIRERADGVLET